jgi:hypothetical protein
MFRPRQAHRVLADEAQEAILPTHVVRLLEEDAHVVIALLEALGAELAALQGWLFPLDLPAHCAAFASVLLSSLLSSPCPLPRHRPLQNFLIHLFILLNF